ncbi:MAG: glycosyltransferase family 2 protein [Acidobacteriia bacterium]|nr:glycosyltransferase family 2 protein [Terriglobia bacterium]
MQDAVVSVVVPTLVGGQRFLECLNALARQTYRDFEVIVVDNSGRNLAGQALSPANPATRETFPNWLCLLENPRNVGFGAAINQAVAATSSPFVATLNDDAVPNPRWLEALLRGIERRPDAGMCASRVCFYGEDCLDSAGMLVASDGSSKQRGHGRASWEFPVSEETLFPSASAALYRRAMLEAIGGFDESFFLYCEDTDLGLRARWAGWKCLYVPDAVVEHHYSQTAGRASPLKAYYVERNRLFVLAKNFPAPLLFVAPFISAARYFWHTWYLLSGHGAAARFRAEGHAGARMLWYVLRAHCALIRHAVGLWRERRRIRAHARITPAVFRHLVRSHSISARKVAAL